MGRTGQGPVVTSAPGAASAKVLVQCYSSLALAGLGGRARKRPILEISRKLVGSYEEEYLGVPSAGEMHGLAA